MVAVVEALTAQDVRIAWGARLVDARKAAGRTQVDLATALQVDQTTISGLERGRTGSLAMYLAYAHELGITLVGLDS
jgi:transcriptional regulator with XRE-family HTH domain